MRLLTQILPRTQECIHTVKKKVPADTCKKEGMYREKLVEGGVPRQQLKEMTTERLICPHFNRLVSASAKTSRGGFSLFIFSLIKSCVCFQVLSWGRTLDLPPSRPPFIYPVPSPHLPLLQSDLSSVQPPSQPGAGSWSRRQECGALPPPPYPTPPSHPPPGQGHGLGAQSPDSTDAL